MIFVTGGTGFLGRHLIAALCRKEYPLKILTRNPERNRWLYNHKNVEIVQGDITDSDKLKQAMKGCRYVIHAGGLFRFWGNAQNFMEANMDGTQNMLDAALHNNIERFIHISTVAVIGHPDPTKVINETYPPQPADPYQRSKFMGETIAKRYHDEHDMPIVILRPGAYYGPLGEYGFNRLFFRDPMRGITMQINGGRYIIFPAYITDVAWAIIESLHKAKAGEVYNICGDWISHKEAFDIVYDEAGLRWPRLRIPGWLGINSSRFLELTSRITRREPFWPINLRSYVYNNWRVSNQKARKELGFAPVSFRDGAKRTIEWYRAGKPQNIPEIDY